MQKNDGVSLAPAKTALSIDKVPGGYNGNIKAKNLQLSQDF